MDYNIMDKIVGYLFHFSFIIKFVFLLVVVGEDLMNEPISVCRVIVVAMCITSIIKKNDGIRCVRKDSVR